MNQDPDVTPVPGESEDGTRTLTEPGPGSGATPSSSGSLDGARFVPGTLLAGRYRIVGLLGRGGMGEVYRAEDLKLGEAVALKFLPAELSLDGAALARFHREVRVARGIAHRNVCRVFDIGEAGGLHFLSMEYIDGEDLSGLLKRIGRLPSDKAVQLARQICAGLGAAHEAGVLHRDMKPANVMVDGKGRAKITDFGLAQVADELGGQAEFAGTPAYMAPEQITAGEVSVKTDLYALGLVLYEMFTGHRAFAEENWRQIMARGGHGDVSRPSTHVEALDPVVETVILRCLEEEPGARPSSALEVSAALPGGDPLAAALAAGETPSPEMVAAAPREGLLKPPVAAGLLAALALCLAAGLWARQRVSVPTLAHLPKSPEVLEDRARTLLRDLGHDREPAAGGRVDSAWGWQMNEAYVQHLKREGTVEDLARLGDGGPPLYWFWYRQSPGTLKPRDFGRWRPSLDDPPRITPGMASVTLDPEGRLVKLHVVPALEEAVGEASPEPDWAPLFAAAELDRQVFSPVEPRWTPPIHTDGRRAWNGPATRPIRVEAAHHGGVPVIFDVLTAWNQPGAAVSHEVTHRSVLILLSSVVAAAFSVGLWLVRRHLRDGRGDRRGASRLALFTISCQLLAWMLGAHHSSGAAEVMYFMQALAYALLWAALFWVFYIAFEPFLRRRWPAGVVGWNRLLGGKLRDPLVGREVLVGSLLGTAGVGLPFVAGEALRRSGGLALSADPAWPLFLHGLRATVAGLFDNVLRGSLTMSFASVFLFVLLYVVLRRKWLATVVSFVFWALQLRGVMSIMWSPEFPHAVPLCLAGLVALATARFGVLTVVALWFHFMLLYYMPTATDLSSWHAQSTVLAVAVTMALGVWGYWAASGGRPLFVSDEARRFNE